MASSAGPKWCRCASTFGVDDRILYNVSRPTLWPYLVPGGGSGAAVVVAPGGGYSHMNERI